mgnify:CR=1 FL=1
MDRSEFVKIKIDDIPKEIIVEYNLRKKVTNDGHVYVEIQKGMYGLPQAGILSNKLLRTRLAQDGYFELPHTPGLWKHVCRPVWFTLVVDNFGVKYIGQENAEHLMNSLKKHYEVEEDWAGQLYCGIKLNWNYDQGYVDTDMVKYTLKNLKKYSHEKPRKPQDCPYEPYPKKYGTAAQDVTPEDTSPSLDKEGMKFVQKVVGSFLYLARAVDSTILMTLNAIANKQSEVSNQYLKKIGTNRSSQLRKTFIDDLKLKQQELQQYFKDKIYKTKKRDIISSLERIRMENTFVLFMKS